MKGQWDHKIFDVSLTGFDRLALDIFRFQYNNNAVYKAYTDSIHVLPANVNSIGQIPFLPIRFFKSHAVQSTPFDPAVTFESSGTTGQSTSRHLVKDTSLYTESFIRGFRSFYGEPSDWCILGLLPSYLERKNSSLVFMINELIKQSNHPASGFYLDEFKQLSVVLKELEKQQQKVLLIGVTFALLDFAEKYPVDLHHITIMETGGMKGRREEMVRPQVHAILKKAFHSSAIHSEYGMTELLSQAYSKGNGIFQTPPWMKILLREEEDPLTVGGWQMTDGGKHTTISGAINVIDLANIYSCSFIATDDAGRLFPDGSFEVIGRIDNSDLRGCSLMVV